MKRSWLKRKTGFKPSFSQMKRSKINVVGHSDTSTKKADIQALLRLIVTHRDGGCMLRDLRNCGGEAEVVDGKVISNVVIQAEHLVTRSNAATFSDTRLVVCICRDCHGWKHWNKDEYDDLVKTVLAPELVELWERCEADRRAHKTYKVDLSLEIVALKKELQFYG